MPLKPDSISLIESKINQIISVLETQLGRQVNPAAATNALKLVEEVLSQQHPDTASRNAALSAMLVQYQVALLMKGVSVDEVRKAEEHGIAVAAAIKRSDTAGAKGGSSEPKQGT